MDMDRHVLYPRTYVLPHDLGADVTHTVIIVIREFRQSGVLTALLTIIDIIAVFTTHTSSF